MQKFIPVILLILQCCIYLTAGEQENKPEGNQNVRILQSNDQGQQEEASQIAEPRISFNGSCGSLRYSRLFQKYQITLPLKIDCKTRVVGLKMKADKDLVSNDSAVKAKIQLLTDAGEAELLLLCDSFERCYSLMEELDTNPDELHPMLRLVVIGKFENSRVEFQELRILGKPKYNCHNGQWEVFQQRLDGNLSFAQSWDAYEKGFGNPNSNYWMGLRLLSAKTVTGAGTSTSRCQLRIETQDFSNNKYWAEYRFFQVLGPEENYEIKFIESVAASTLSTGPIDYHNNAPFSTFDRDHDTASISCSRHFGYGGWWFKACGQWHLNSAYPYDNTAINQEAYIGVILSGRRVPMKSTKMLVKCNY